MRVPYFDIAGQHKSLKGEILGAIKTCFDENAFILGSHVEAFEKDFAKFAHVKHAIGVNSGTSALHLALMALGVGPGDEVITTPFTFAASAWAISYVGATPVFVDVEDATFNINPAKIEPAITERTKAVIAVHLYGHPCDMDPIVDICNRHKLFLLEDAAQAHGARYKGQPVGTFGNVATYSFYPVKNLGACGEAGAVVTDDDLVAKRVRLLRNHGSVKRYHHEVVGYNYRMEGIQGAVLGVKLKYVNQWNEERLFAATQYHHLLARVSSIDLPQEALWAESVYHLFTIMVPKRDALCEYLTSEGIGHLTHYAVPMHLQECYKELGYKRGDLPVAEQLTKRVVNLPLFPGITKAQLERVAEVLMNFYGETEAPALDYTSANEDEVVEEEVCTT